MRTASCHCGDLALACSGEPRRVSMCHCLDCQRRTGSAFSVAVFYLRDQVAVERGMPAAYERASASGYPVTFHFCPRCGSNLFWHPARMPGLVGVAIGAFADPTFPMPEQSVWTGDKHDWFDLPAGMARRFEKTPRPAG
jgi:hypothetical protein